MTNAYILKYLISLVLLSIISLQVAGPAAIVMHWCVTLLHPEIKTWFSSFSQGCRRTCFHGKLRCRPLGCPIVILTTATIWDTIINNHIPLAALQHLLTFFSLQTSTSILASNGDSYSLQRYFPQPRSYINFVYFQPLTRFPILTFLPSTTVFSFLVWAISVEPRRVRGLIVEGNSVVL